MHLLDVRSIARRALVASALAPVLILTGCDKPFYARNVYFNNSDDRGSRTAVAVVALTESEFKELQAVQALDKRAAFERDMEEPTGRWAHRSKVVELTSKKADHLILGKNDELWKNFRNAKNGVGAPAVWFAVLVVDTNWTPKVQEEWIACYKASPDDELGELPAVEFNWTPTKGVACLSKEGTGGH